MKPQEARPVSVTRRRWLGLAGGAAFVGFFERIGGATAVLSQQGASRGAVNFPPGSVIRTITRDVDPKVLGSGVTLIHEHPALAVRDDLSLLVTELQQARADGLAW